MRFDTMTEEESGSKRRVANYYKLWFQHNCIILGIYFLIIASILLVALVYRQQSKIDFKQYLENEEKATTPAILNATDAADLDAKTPADLDAKIPVDLDAKTPMGLDATTAAGLQTEDDLPIEVDHFKISDDLSSPCNNFYHFACKNWHKSNPRPWDSTEEWSFRSLFRTKIDGIIREIVKEKPQKGDISALTKARDYYGKCFGFFNGNPDFYLKDTIKFCIGEVSTLFQYVIGQQYLKKVYKSRQELYGNLDQVENMAVNIWKQVLKLVEINPEREILPKTFDAEKLKKMETCLGFPTWIFNDTRMEEEYRDLHFKSWMSFTDYVETAQEWLTKKEHENNSMDSKGCYWYDFSDGDGAYFNPLSFQVYISMGMIQSCYDISHGLPMIYGSLGFVIGHAYVHTLYDSGWKTNKNERFTEVEKCLKDQFDDFTVDGLREQGIFVDGNRTMEENYADIGGLQVAYSAYKQASSKLASSNNKFKTDEINNELEEEYTDDQLFFLGVAQRWCKSYTMEEMRREMQEYKVHTPTMFRILGSFQNFEEFARAWNCPVGSPMNPHKSRQQKCLVFKK